MPEHADVAQSSSMKWPTLGSLWTVYGVVRLAVALALLLYSNVATVMFGALLTRVPNPFFLMGIFHFCYFAGIVIMAFSGVFAVLAGSALLARKSSARTLAIVGSVLSLADIPFGTTLGIYTLLLFLR
jgi:hypothetical protein